MALEYVDRPPRIHPELPFAEHDIPQAPDIKEVAAALAGIK